MTNTQLQQRAIAVMNRLNKLGFTKNGKPMVIDQAYELVAAEENLKNQHVLRSQLEEEVTLALIPDHPEDCEGSDFIMRSDATSVWLTVGQFSVNVLRGTQAGPDKDEGIRVMVYPLGDSDECLDQLTVFPTLTQEVAAEMARKREILERFGYRFELDHSMDTWVVTINGEEQDVTFSAELFAVEQSWDNAVVLAKEAKAMSEKVWRTLSSDTKETFVTNYLLTVGWTAALIPQLEAAGYSLCESDFKRPYWEHESTGEASEDFDTEEQAWIDAWKHAKKHFVQLNATDNIPHVSIEDWSSSENPETEEQVPQTEMQAAIQQLIATWANGDSWGEHPHYTRGSWQYEVSNDDTTLGYWEWVVHQIDGNGGEDEHCACGTPLNDGEGWDGQCGDCADKAETAQKAEPVIDRRTHTTYSFSIGALTRDQLEDECADKAVPFEFYNTEPDAELRTELLSRYDNAVRTAAEQALDTSVDGMTNVEVAAHSGWETSEVGHSMIMRRAIFLENARNTATSKIYFTVEIVNCAAVNSSWSD